jgi:hypothetical protein
MRVSREELVNFAASESPVPRLGDTCSQPIGCPILGRESDHHLDLIILAES